MQNIRSLWTSYWEQWWRIQNVALINKLNGQAAERKLVSIFFKKILTIDTIICGNLSVILFLAAVPSGRKFLPLGTAAKKSLTDKFPQMILSMVSLRELKENCEQALSKPGNRTLERFKFFSRKQKDKETLPQFRTTLGHLELSSILEIKLQLNYERVHTTIYEQQY